MKEMKESKRSEKVRQDIMINTSEILIFMLYILRYSLR